MQRFWQNRAQRAATLSPAELSELKAGANRVRHTISQFVTRANKHLVTAEGRKGTVRHHANADWTWRPDAWTAPASPRGGAPAHRSDRIGNELAIFHDCPLQEIIWQQIRNTRPQVIAPFGLQMEVFAFGGTFLSFALDLPGAALDRLSNRHIVSVEADIEMEEAIEIYARLNIKHGPNTEQVVRQITEVEDTAAAEFDLGYTDLAGKKPDAVWLDMIFEGPSMNRITIFDLALTRRPRAAL